MRFLTATVLDHYRDIESDAVGFPPGIVAVWDESEGYMAATEFCYRVALATAFYDPIVIWVDLRKHLHDVLQDNWFEGRDVEGILFEGIQGVEWDLGLLRDLCTTRLGQRIVVLVDSLPAVSQFVEDRTGLQRTIAAIANDVKKNGNLVVMCSYATGRSKTGKVLGVGAAPLNRYAHTSVCATHRGGEGHTEFGVLMTLSRVKVPTMVWEWDDAKISVGA